MQYTLITRQGRVMQFYVLELAEMYQARFGGVIAVANSQELAYA